MRKAVIISVLSILLLSGCKFEMHTTSDDIKFEDTYTAKTAKVGKPVKVAKKFKSINPEIVCDKRGYAYYEIVSNTTHNHRVYSYTPVLENARQVAKQVKCKSLEP